MKTKTATAMALALVVGVAGLSAVPFAAADHSNCHADFQIADQEPDDLDARPLLAGQSEVGHEGVLALIDETLHIELVDAGTNGQLNWTVYEKDDQENCVVFTQGGCNGSTPNVIRTEGEAGQQTCTLEAPVSGSMSYWVLFEAGDQNDIKYKPWVST